jgi:hypothetical protein
LTDYPVAKPAARVLIRIPAAKQPAQVLPNEIDFPHKDCVLSSYSHVYDVSCG